MRFVNERHAFSFADYFTLYEWSISNIPDFWAAVWDFLDIKASMKYDKVVDDLSRFPGADWFPGAELNFAENLLRYRDDTTAVVFKAETRPPMRMTYRELSTVVARVANALKAFGVSSEDRVVGYMPNIPQTPIAMLAATSLGATWASCGSELGVQAVIDRFSQVSPKVLFTVDGYLYKNKPFTMLADVRAVVKAVPSIEKVVVVPYASESPDISAIRNAVFFNDFLSSNEELEFTQVPAGHPVYIMFSSGTTGKPKCMVQSVGGILVNQLKELIIHADLKREDKVLYMTAPSWMMWNWLMAVFGVGATVVLFDGNPGYPDMGTMWRLVDEEQITFFGTSATYINLLKSQNYRPKDLFSLSLL